MIAHQGGWDEMLLVLGPIAVIIGLLTLARKRVGATQRHRDEHTVNPQPQSPDRKP
jgi:hypothetical protein